MRRVERRIDKIKDQVRRLLSEEQYLTVSQMALLSVPPVSSAAMAIALNQLHSEGETRHIPGCGWTLTNTGGDDDADAA